MVESEISYNPQTKGLFYSFNGIDVSVKLSQINDEKLMKIIREVIKAELENSLKIA